MPQEQTFEIVGAPRVKEVLDGFNSTFMAFGQTGTGKTYTVFGPPTYSLSNTVFGYKPPIIPCAAITDSNTAGASPLRLPSGGESCDKFVLDEESGFIPRAMAQIFEYIQAHRDEVEFQVTLCYLQIYRECLYDLLVDDSEQPHSKLQIREDAQNGVYVDGIVTLPVATTVEVLEAIQKASERRIVAATDMNEVSSRSHVIMMLTLEQRRIRDNRRQLYSNSSNNRNASNYLNSFAGASNSVFSRKSRFGGNSNNNNNNNNGNGNGDSRSGNTPKVKRSTLCVVDLAGSERVSKTLSSGQRLDEAKKINQSLSTLGKCVKALSDGAGTHVPFRESKLTRLLTDSLGGNSKTTICATVGPSIANYDETYSTLLFAAGCMSVRTHARINETDTFRDLPRSLRQQLSDMAVSHDRLLLQNEQLIREIEMLRSSRAQNHNMDNRQSSTLYRQSNLPYSGEKDYDSDYTNEENYDSDGRQQYIGKQSHEIDDGRLNRKNPEFPTKREITDYSDKEFQELKQECREKTWLEREKRLTSEFEIIISRLRSELKDRTDELMFLQNAAVNVAEELASVGNLPYTARVGAIFTEGSYVTCNPLTVQRR